MAVIAWTPNAATIDPESWPIASGGGSCRRSRERRPGPPPRRDVAPRGAPGHATYGMGPDSVRLGSAGPWRRWHGTRGLGPARRHARTIAAMNTKHVMARLEELGDEKRRAFNAKRGAGDNQFGVKTGDIRKLAKELKGDHELGLSLWETGNADAQMLAILLVRPKDLDTKQLATMAKEGTCEWVADWLTS